MNSKLHRTPKPRKFHMEQQKSSHTSPRSSFKRIRPADRIRPDGSMGLSLSPLKSPKLEPQTEEEPEIDTTITKYTPEPSLDDQFHEIGRLYDQIKKFLSIDTDDTANSISSSVVSNQEQNKNDDFDFEPEFEHFIELLNVYLNDICTLFSTESKNNFKSQLAEKSNSDNTENETPKEHHDFLNNSLPIIDNNLQDAMTLFDDLQQLQISVLQQQLNHDKLDYEFYQDFISSIEHCRNNFIENYMTMCNNSVDDQNPIVYEHYLRANLYQILTQRSQDLYQLSSQSFSELDKMENEQQQPTEDLDNPEQPVSQQAEACEKYGELLSNLIVDGYLFLSKTWKQMLQIELKLPKPADEQKSQQDDPENQVEIDDKQDDEIQDDDSQTEKTYHVESAHGLLRESHIYEEPEHRLLPPLSYPSAFCNSRVLYMNNLFKYQSQLEEKQDEYESQFHPLLPIIKSINDKCSLDLFNLVYGFWLTTHELELTECQKVYGNSLVNFVRDQVDADGQVMTSTRIVELIKISIEMQDDYVSSQLLSIYERHITENLKQITSLQEEELEFLTNTIPDQFCFNPDEPESNNELIQHANNIRNEIHDLVVENAQSLMVFFDAFFLYRRIVENQPQEENENENEVLQFSVPDEEFRNRIQDYLKRLKALSKQTLEELLVNISSSPKDSESMTSGNSAISSASARSDVSRYSQLTKAEARQRAKHIICTYDSLNDHNDSIDFQIGKLQCQLTKQAIVRTCEEQFLILQYLLVSSVRDLDAERADQYNKAIQELYKRYQIHLETYKKLCLQSLDVDASKTAVSKLPEMRNGIKEYILNSLNESYKDLLIKSIDRYLFKIKDIENIYEQETEFLENDFYDKKFKLEADTDNESSQIDKDYAINCAKPNQAHNVLITQKEKFIRQLLTQGQYEQADKEKKALQALKNEEKEERKKTAHNVRKESKKQQEEKIKKKEKEIEEANYAAQLRYYQKMEKDCSDQAKTLRTAIKATQQKLMLFASRLILNDPTVKKELIPQLDYVTKETLKEYKLDYILEPLKK